MAPLRAEGVLLRRSRNPHNAATREFWSAQSGSLHRGSDDAFFGKKAREHVELMPPVDRESIADFACGAGELLAHLAPLVQIEVASDYSEPMLGEAAARLIDSDIELLHRDGLKYAREATQRVWTTCGGLNQYLEPQSLQEWLRLFAENEYAQALYGFDCVDPHRYRTLRLHSGYIERELRWSARMRLLAHRIMTLPAGATRRTWAYLGTPSMGYGYTPAHFRALAAEFGLCAEFYSSRLYEYRFHAVLRKTPA